jgi:hypothetical protein
MLTAKESTFLDSNTQDFSQEKDHLALKFWGLFNETLVIYPSGFITELSSSRLESSKNYFSLKSEHAIS